MINFINKLTCDKLEYDGKKNLGNMNMNSHAFIKLMTIKMKLLIGQDSKSY